MKLVRTQDNSITYYNAEVGDHYHSKSGAIEEAFEKHASALRVTEIKKPIIYDLFFGLGYNSAAAIDLCDSCTIYCFENDRAILEKILEIDANFKSWKIIQSFIRNYLDNNVTVYDDGQVKMVLLFGDAREMINVVDEKANFVFFDAFSPAKVPELWQVDFFKDIFDHMKANSKLSTYSCARFVRDNFREAGFVIEDGPIIGRRSPSTIAIKKI